MFKKLWNILVNACKVVKGVFNTKPTENFLPYKGEAEFVIVSNEVVFSWTRWFDGKYRMTDYKTALLHFREQSYRNNCSAAVITGLSLCSLLIVLSGNVELAAKLGFLAICQYIGNELNNARVACNTFFA